MAEIVSETVIADTSSHTDRIPVPGGWLYRTFFVAGDQDGAGVASTFVSDESAVDRLGKIKT